MNQPRDEHVAVTIIGGGPAGLTAAAELAPRTDGEVRVIEREADTGGIPRHSDRTLEITSPAGVPGCTPTRSCSPPEPANAPGTRG